GRDEPSPRRELEILQAPEDDRQPRSAAQGDEPRAVAADGRRRFRLGPAHRESIFDFRSQHVLSGDGACAARTRGLGRVNLGQASPPSVSASTPNRRAFDSCGREPKLVAPRTVFGYYASFLRPRT